MFAKTKAQISCVVTAQLICAFVFAYAKSRFSHDVPVYTDMFLSFLQRERVLSHASSVVCHVKGCQVWIDI